MPGTLITETGYYSHQHSLIDGGLDVTEVKRPLKVHLLRQVIKQDVSLFIKRITKRNPCLFRGSDFSWFVTKADINQTEVIIENHIKSQILSLY